MKIYVVLEVPLGDHHLIPIPEWAQEVLETLEEAGWVGVKLQCVTDTPPTPHGREW